MFKLKGCMKKGPETLDFMSNSPLVSSETKGNLEEKFTKYWYFSFSKLRLEVKPHWNYKN